MKLFKVIHSIIKFFESLDYEYESKPLTPTRRRALIRAKIRSNPQRHKTYPKGEMFRDGSKVYYNCHNRGIVRIR